MSFLVKDEQSTKDTQHEVLKILILTYDLFKKRLKFLKFMPIYYMKACI